jgi:exosortase
LIQSQSRRLARVRLACLLALAAIAYHGLVLWDPRSHGFTAVVGWFFEASDSSPQVIFAIVAALLVRRRGELAAGVGGATAPALAALCLVPAVALHLWAQWVDAPDLSVVSLGLVVLGAGFLLGGRPLARELAAPLALLVFAIPIPGAFHNLIVYPFQLAAARFVDAALTLVGHEVLLQGDVLTLGGREFEVIETCSGLRSVQTLILLACAWAVFFRCSLWHGVGLLLTAPVIAYVTNGLRVLILVVDTRPEVQESHVAQGILMILVGSAALALVDRGLLRLRAAPADAAEAQGAEHAEARFGLWPVAFALAVMALAALALPEIRPAAAELPAASDLPRQLAGWKVRDGEDPGLFLGNVRFTQRSTLDYVRGEESVTVFLGWDDRQLRIRSLLSEKNAVPGRGWVVEAREPLELEPGPVRMERILARRFAQRALALYAYRGVGSVLEETFRAALALDQPGSPFARPGRSRMLRLSTLVNPRPGGQEEAEERLRRLFADLAPVLVW